MKNNTISQDTPEKKRLIENLVKQNLDGKNSCPPPSSMGDFVD